MSSFEEQFKELKDLSCGCFDYCQGICNNRSIKDIEKFCLSKSKVKEAIIKILSVPTEDKNIRGTTKEAILLIRELGLENEEDG